MKKIVKSVRWLVILGVVVSLMTVAGATALSDWDPGACHKMHFPQLPDLETGMDIYSGSSEGPPPTMLADDFQCTESGPITDIHVWGSWLEDMLPPEPPVFQIGIWDNIPVGPHGYSVPGALLWTRIFNPGDYTAREYAYPVEELWAIPDYACLSPPYIIAPDYRVWQYNFYIDPAEAFPQEVGTTYWLSVWEISYQDVYWGWKTSLDHWQDNAVFTQWPPVPIPEQWCNLDPTGPPLDLAFVITGPPPPPPPPPTRIVGGTVVQEDMPVVLLPWLLLAGLLVVITGVGLLARRRLNR